MEERKAYKVELTEEQKERLDILLDLVNSLKVGGNDECIKLKEIVQDNMKESKFPRIGDKYFYVSGYGEVLYTDYDNDAYDVGALKIDNCFRTEEEAEFELERLKVITEMKKFAEPENSICDGNAAHCYICCDGNDSIMINVHYNYKSDLIYFLSSEMAQKCIDSVGEDRIKKYYLRVKD